MPKQNTGRPTGVRLNRRVLESTRAKIRSALLINRLEAFVLGERERSAGKRSRRKVFLTADQVRAAMGLLDRSVPTLQRTEHTGADGGPILHGSADELTDDELALIAAGGRPAPAQPQKGTH